MYGNCNDMFFLLRFMRAEILFPAFECGSLVRTETAVCCTLPHRRTDSFLLQRP